MFGLKLFWRNYDFKTLKLRERMETVEVKLRELFDAGEIEPVVINRYQPDICKLPYNFSVKYFNKRLDVLLDFKDFTLERIRLGGWLNYPQREILTLLREDVINIKYSLIKKYGKPKFEEEFPSRQELARFPFDRITFARWIFRKKIIELKVLMTYKPDPEEGGGGYALEIKRKHKPTKEDKIQSDM